MELPTVIAATHRAAVIHQPHCSYLVRIQQRMEPDSSNDLCDKSLLSAGETATYKTVELMLGMELDPQLLGAIKFDGKAVWLQNILRLL